METFHYGIDQLNVDIAMQIAFGKQKAVLKKEVIDRINNCAQNVAQIAISDKVVYGINTGFGPLCDTVINPEQTAQLQYNLLISHAVGVGEPISPLLAKLMMICKVQALSFGYSGVSIEVIERVLWHIENDIIPIVPQKGSVGASGDLAPLSHLFLPLIGLGQVLYKNKTYETADLLSLKGMDPLTLKAKEGLGLINGTQFILAHAVYGLYQLQHLLNWADIIGAMSLEAFMGSAAPFTKELHLIRPFEGTQLVAERLNKILKGSEILSSHTQCDRVQDPYSLRCMPQVHGASRNAWIHVNQLVEIELNSVTDNPIVLNDSRTISGGNFHGQPLAMALDYLTIASSEIGNISDRRSYLLLEGKYGLPKLLIKDSGLNSGLMIPQYTTAALVTENKSLCFPSSADSIPTSLGQEDHVSMGSISGVKLLKVINNLEYILAIELLMASQGVSLRNPLQTSPFLQNVLQEIRSFVDFITADRLFHKDIKLLHNYLTSNQPPEL